MLRTESICKSIRKARTSAKECNLLQNNENRGQGDMKPFALCYKSQEMIKQRIALDIYPVVIYLYCHPNTDYSSFAKHYNNLKTAKESGDLLELSDRGAGMIMWNSADWKTVHLYISWENRYNAGVISHECFHIVHHIMKNIGARLTDDSEECYAYLLSLISDKVLANINKTDAKVNQANT